MARSGVWHGGVVAVLALAVQAWWLWQLGPVLPPDSGSFIAAARELAGPGGGFLGPGRLHEAALPWSFYRAPGYPLLILLHEALWGAFWAWGLVGTQLLLAGAATLAFHRTLLALTQHRGLSLLGGLAQAGSFALVVHPAILSDSLYGSLLCLALALLLQGGMAGGVGLGTAFAAGLLLGLATLLREVGAYLNLLWIPLALVALRPGALNRAAGLVVFAAPMLAAPLALLAWNAARAGSPFLTTVGQVVYFQALLPLAARGVAVFATDPVLAQAAGLAFPPFTNVEVVALNHHLFQPHALEAPALARLASATWRHAWAEHPWRMAGAAASRIKAHYLFTPFIPLENFALVPLWTEGSPRLLARFDRLTRAALAGTDAALVALFLLAALSRAMALALSAAFLATPLVAARAWRHAPGAKLALACWPILPATLGLHALVHLEIRYFVPAMPALLAAACFTLAQLPGLSAKPGPWFLRSQPRTPQGNAP
jgi:hypothetical protein